MLRARNWRDMAGSEAVTRWDALASMGQLAQSLFRKLVPAPTLEGFDPDGRVKLLCIEADGELAGLCR